MSRRAIWPALLIGAAISAVVALLYHALAPWTGAASGLRFALLLAASLHLLWLLRTGSSGRVLTTLAWLLLAGALLLLNPPLPLWLLALVGATWLLRALSTHCGLHALGSALLTALSLAAGVVTALHTNSLLLSLWSYFLLQALHVWLPQRATVVAAADASEHDFESSLRRAETALRQLSLRL